MDLLRLFPYTESGQRLREVDLGTPAADAYLRDGWSRGETLPTGESVVWATSRIARMAFTLPQRAARRLVVRYRVSPSARGSRRKLIVRFNHRMVGRLDLREAWQEHTLDLPERSQRVGKNILEFFNPFFARRGPSGERQPAPRVGYDWVRIEGEGVEGERGDVDRGPFLSRDGAVLVIPSGSRVDYFIRLPTEAQMFFDLRGANGSGQARLRVTLTRGDRREKTLFAGTRSSARLDLSAYATEMVELSFTAEGKGEVRMQRPRIMGRGRAEHREGWNRHEPLGPGRNVLLYVIDTLRADHLGCYGYKRPTSPHIDALAAGSILFTHASAQASWTRPATASILTGLYPYDHGTLTLRDRLRPGVTTLAEVLAAAGFETAAFVTNVNVNGRLGFKQGFAQFLYLPEDAERPSVHVRSDEVNRHVFPWLREHGDRPFFLYMHVTDPHAPYTPPPALAERFSPPRTLSAGIDGKLLKRLRTGKDMPTPANIARLVSRYDAEIASVDESFGHLVAELKRLGLYERTVIVLAGDHGEEFHDHGGFEHGHTLYREQLLVPLIVRFPASRFRQRRLPILARQIDIMPTVLDYLGVAAPEEVRGRSLMPWIAGKDLLSDADAFAQTSLGRRQIEALQTGRWKVIRSMDLRGETIEAYDLESDPREQVDRADERPVEVGYARQAATRFASDSRAREQESRAPDDVDPTTVKLLKELGYVVEDAE